MIYFIQSGKNGPIKIGHAKNSAEGRMAQLQVANPEKLFLLATMEGNIEKEHVIQMRFENYLISGEWFRPNDKLAQFIFRINKGIVLKSKLCECGCGDYANVGKRFIVYHNRKRSIGIKNIIAVKKNKRLRRKVYCVSQVNCSYKKNKNIVNSLPAQAQQQREKLSILECLKKSSGDKIFWIDEHIQCKLNECMTQTSREEYVLYMRRKGYTFKKIGQKLGVTQMRIRQIEAKAIRKIRWCGRIKK